MPLQNRHQMCSICGENDALIYVKVLMENQMEEKGLCAHCAIKYMENKDHFKKLDFIDKRVLDALEEMRSLLTSIVTNISAITSAVQSKKNIRQNDGQPVCSNCGLTYENFKDTGYFGCPYCYQAFKDQIKELIFELERSTVHRGKMPKKYAKLYLLKKEVKFLKNQLKKYIFNEKYEEAEKIKKRLDKLIGSYPVGKQDEIY